MDKLDWLAAYILCCGILCLAHFNTDNTTDKSYFQGLPSPVAARIVAGFVWLMNDLHFISINLNWSS